MHFLPHLYLHRSEYILTFRGLRAIPSSANFKFTVHTIKRNLVLSSSHHLLCDLRSNSLAPLTSMLKVGSMATKLVQSPILPSHVALPSYAGENIINLQRLARGAALSFNISVVGKCQYGLRRMSAARVAENTAWLMGDDTIVQKKAELYQSLEGINRGLFGIPSAKRFEIEDLAKQLETHNPTPDPTLYLKKVVGCWKLIYSNITILGSKRTKLGLRDFISLDDVFQTIDVAKSKAVNEIKFSSRGLNLLNGQLTIEASFKITSNSRVEITYDSSTITPDQLMNLFRKNYDVLLNIFNPEGWLEITYVDDTMRIGRDDKGNIFILERCP